MNNRHKGFAFSGFRVQSWYRYFVENFARPIEFFVCFTMILSLAKFVPEICKQRLLFAGLLEIFALPNLFELGHRTGCSSTQHQQQTTCAYHQRRDIQHHKSTSADSYVTKQHFRISLHAKISHSTTELNETMY